MWWLVALLVLALVAFFFVKKMKSNTEEQQALHDVTQQNRLQDAASAQVNTAVEGDSTVAEGSGVSASAGAAANVAAAGATAVGAASAAASVSTGSQNDAPASVSIAGVPDSGDTLTDVREMIKVLNLDGPDAGRLQIERDQLIALRKGQTDGIPDSATIESVAHKLRKMLA